MIKAQGNQAGFGAMGVLAILVALAVVGLGGWVTYKHNHKAKTDQSKTSQSNKNKPSSNQNSATADASAAMKSYTDDNLSFQYPSTWKVTDKTHEHGPKQWVELAGPVDDAIAINKEQGATTNRHLVIDIRPLGAPGTCRETCTIYDVTDPGIAKSNSRLVISDWDSQGSARVLELVDHVQAVKGAGSYKVGATVNGRQVRVYGSVTYNNGSSFGSIDDVDAFKKTISYQDVLKILGSLKIQE